MHDNFLTWILCVVGCPLWAVAGRFWGEFDAAQNVTEVFLCDLWTHFNYPQ